MATSFSSFSLFQIEKQAAIQTIGCRISGALFVTPLSRYVPEAWRATSA